MILSAGCAHASCAFFIYKGTMLIKQVELKSANIKALASLDKSIRLIFDVNLNNDSIDVNELHQLLYKPLILEIKEDEE